MLYLLEVLFPYIVLFYAVDCFVYLRRHHLVFSSHFGRRFNRVQGGAALVALSPVGRAYYAQALPVFFADQGVYLASESGQGGSTLYDEENLVFFFYDDITTIETASSKTVINGDETIDWHSPIAARLFADRIETLQKLPAPERASQITQFLAEETDLKQIAALRTKPSRLLFNLKLLSLVLFGYLFVMLPLHLYFKVPLSLPLLLYATLAVYLATLGFTHFYYKKYCRTEHRGLSLLLTLLLSPVTALHVVPTLTKYKFSRFDHLALSAALLPAGEFCRLARKELLKLRYSMKICRNHDFLAALGRREESLRRLLAAAGIAEQELFTPPARSEQAAAGYCPLCEAQFQAGVQCCPDCDIELTPYR